MVLENVKQIHVDCKRQRQQFTKNQSKKKVASFGTTSEGHTLNRPQTHPSKTRRPYQRVLNNHQPLLTVFWSPIVLGIFEPMWQRGNVANDWKKSLPMWCGMDTTGSGEKDIRTYVQKKREVFLVHMACDNKREEAVSWTHWLRKCHVFFFAANHSSHG